MTPRNFAGCSGVIVDECRSHGVWFDAGELARIMQFIREGGLDRARARRDQRFNEAHRLKTFGTRLDSARTPRYGGADPEAATNEAMSDVLKDFLHVIASVFG